MFRSFRWIIIIPFMILVLLSTMLISSIWENWYKSDIKQLIQANWIKQISFADKFTEYDLYTYLDFLANDSETYEISIDVIDKQEQLKWSTDANNFQQRVNDYRTDYYIEILKNSEERYYAKEISDIDTNFISSILIYKKDQAINDSQYIVLTYPMEQMLIDNMKNKLPIVKFMIVLLTAIGLMLSVYIWRSISRPLNKINTITTRVAQGQYEYKLVINRQDEIGILANTLNQMIEAISKQVTEISEEKSKLEGLLNNLLSGVILISQDGRIQYVNRSAEKILHVHRASIIGFHYQDLLEEYGLRSHVDKALNKGENYQEQLTFKKANIIHVADVNILPIRNINRLIHSVIVVLYDISEIKRLEQVRTEFVANVSHELKTPITSIRGFAETIVDGTIEDKDTTLEFIKIIYKEADRLSKLVHDLLELSKIESNNVTIDKQYSDIVEIANDVMASLYNQAQKDNKQITFYANKPRIIHFVNVDCIKQLFINLIGNAIDYSKEESKISIRIFDNDHDIVIEVEDNGFGIPEQDINRIFERFYRVHKDRSRVTGGTGLGLSIVKHIVEIHDGNIEVSSKVGVGTIFRVIFPKDLYK
jgi:two-component system phosphate regulon sensor histidine kinase PhoR